MSSTNKTEKLQLNRWIATDKPERTDFNRDNEIIDSVMSNHTENEDIHITPDEREKWTEYFYSGIYYGDGSSERVINTGCPFDIGFGFIFADNKPFSVVNFSQSQNRTYACFFHRGAASLGAHLGDNNRLTVKLNATANFGNEYANLNERGVVYHYFLFRAF